jgi:hypothetical protein
MGVVDSFRNNKSMGGSGTIMVGVGMAATRAFTRMAHAWQEVQSFANNRNKCELGYESINKNSPGFF